uniref:Uncharacterized protein n=1 Tax=Romanomermis culicivorax TaxID=13658 RepID=A0A915HYN0_ROMCU
MSLEMQNNSQKSTNRHLYIPTVAVKFIHSYGSCEVSIASDGKQVSDREIRADRSRSTAAGNIFELAL